MPSIGRVFIASVCFLGACAAPTAFRWDANSPFATFKGTEAEQLAAVDAVVTHTDRIDSMTMFVAADTAYQLKRLEDAGFLLYAAQLRGAADLERFQPSGSGGNSPAVYLSFLNSSASQVINEAVFDHPQVLQTVAERFSRWSCGTVSWYQPGWSYRVKMDTDPCEGMKRINAKQMKDTATLLADSEYFEATRVVKQYNTSGPTVRNSAESKDRYQKARSTLIRIEREKGIRGMGSEMP